MGKGKKEKLNQVSGDAFPIPDAILSEILLYIPSKKNIFHLKGVSKGWRSLISDPSFAATYISKYPSSFPPPRHIIVHRSIDQDDPKSDSSFRIPIVQVKKSGEKDLISILSIVGLDVPSPQILGSCDGGLLLCSYVRLAVECYFVCNPAAKKIALIREPSFSKPLAVGLISEVENISGVPEKYMVVQITDLVGNEPILNQNRIGFKVYSSETCDWSTVTDDDIQWPEHIEAGTVNSWSFGPGIPFNGRIYWLIKNHRTILSYDPFSDNVGPGKRCKFVGLPTTRPNPDAYATGVLNVSEGHLRYVELSVFVDSSGLWSWVLKDDDSSDWGVEKECRDDRIIHAVSYNHCAYRPLAINPVDKDVNYFWHRCSIVSYDIGTQKMATVEDRWDSVLAYGDVFPYVYPIWPVSIPQGAAARS